MVKNTTHGEFRVAFDPLEADDEIIGRMRVTKSYTGGLTGSGVAQMLTVGTPIEDSAAYVALEQVTGTLDGRQGAFVLQHTGTMRRGEGGLSVTVVPDSGTGELLGLHGTCTIENLGTQHRYVLDYTIDNL
ncbi:DUF3224 domain-containing protein [Actinoplanes sp. NPDC049599]|jgi:hypothetical protein|uniref:DUF3224 domain-containing protein n=1 Tax=Actinoplanes sp. NPDC049599 TaxID=3363903 RepID=UPI003798471E